MDNNNVENQISGLQNTGEPIPENLKSKEEVPKGKVLVDEVTLSNILTRLQELEGKTENIEDRTIRTLNHTARVRFTDDEMTKVVIGYGKSFEKTELGGRKFLVIQVLNKDIKTGETGMVEAEYVKFMEEGKFKELEIVSTKKEKVDVGRGTVNKTRVDFAGYRTEDIGQSVKLQVLVDQLIYTMKLEDGTTVEIPEAGLN